MSVSSTEPFTDKTSVIVTHNLGHKPDDWIEDENGNEIFGATKHDSVNQFTTTFGVAQSGTIHYQDVLSSTSTITYKTQAFTSQTFVLVSHGLGYEPFVWIEDGSGNVIMAEVKHISINEFTVTFGVAQTGTIHYKEFIYYPLSFTLQGSVQLVHNLGYKPHVWFRDDTGKVFFGEVSHSSVNVFEAKFGVLQTGVILYGSVSYDYSQNVSILGNVTVVDSDLIAVFPEINNYKPDSWSDLAQPILDEKKSLYRKIQQITGKTDSDMEADIRDLKTDELKSRIVYGALVRVFKATKNWELANIYDAMRLGVPLAIHDDVDGDQVFDEGERTMIQVPRFSR